MPRDPAHAPRVVLADARRRRLGRDRRDPKATVGAHEVITTIMLNWIAYCVGSRLFGLGGPLQGDGPVGPALERHRRVGASSGRSGEPGSRRLHTGIFIALAALFVYSVHPQPDDARATRCARSGFNPEAARYGGISVAPELLPRDGDLRHVRGARRRARHPRVEVPARHELTCRRRRVGFIGIAVALLGRNKAVGVGSRRSSSARCCTGRRRGASTRRSSRRSWPGT